MCLNEIRLFQALEDEIQINSELLAAASTLWRKWMNHSKSSKSLYCLHFDFWLLTFDFRLAVLVPSGTHSRSLSLKNCQNPKFKSLKPIPLFVPSYQCVSPNNNRCEPKRVNCTLRLKCRYNKGFQTILQEISHISAWVFHSITVNKAIAQWPQNS